MNELLQKHGCSNVFALPEGLKELMSDITREVLRTQPPNICDFIAKYLSVLLITREHGILAVKILEDLCDCRPSVSEHLLQLGIDKSDAEVLAQVIKAEVEGFEPMEGKETLKETEIIKKILKRMPLDEEMTAKVCQVARNAYRDYWYKKTLMEKELKPHPEEPWELAAQHTIELYSKTKPSFEELTRATQKIQAAYKGYHVRRNLLHHLKPKKKTESKVDLPGPPLDIDGSRDIDLGPIINLKVRDDNVKAMFETENENLIVNCDSIKAITHVEDDGLFPGIPSQAIRPRKVFALQENLIEDPAKSDVKVTETESTDLQHAVDNAQRSVSLPTTNAVHHDLPMRKISFAEVPSEVDPAEPKGELEGLNIPEEIIEEDSANRTDTEENIHEIPEEVPDDRTEGDGDSAPTVSILSSAPETPNVTDAEDVDEFTSEEEG
ncbi:uncharacterized protein LOC101747030 isoform X1 [Bombyx mori]|uniref:RIIa domain-containing protein n=1 Tax=Bombyx mori TaxID=7091 RepID=A0A8R2G835_BOMMO|nr:uncharacterized protein LOC101747030 isoform X1 [Bombyx mori]